MLADPRSQALATRFGGAVVPSAGSRTRSAPIRTSTRTSTRTSRTRCSGRRSCSSTHLVREDRSILTKLFDRRLHVRANERLANPLRLARGRRARNFRKRRRTPTRTRQAASSPTGAVLVLTSLANRTSPVLRGKWVMEVLMGTPPPPPPPNVPDPRGDLRCRRRPHAHHPRADGSCTRRTRPATRAIASWIRSAWRSTTSTSPRKWRMRENGMPLDTRGDVLRRNTGLDPRASWSVCC